MARDAAQEVAEALKDWWVRNVVFSCHLPPTVEMIKEYKEGDVRTYVWKWRYGKTTVYGFDAHVCQNNVLSLRSLSEEDVKKWLENMDEINNFLRRISAQCIYAP